MSGGISEKYQSAVFDLLFRRQVCNYGESFRGSNSPPSSMQADQSGQADESEIKGCIHMSFFYLSDRGMRRTFRSLVLNNTTNQCKSVWEKKKRCPCSESSQQVFIYQNILLHSILVAVEPFQKQLLFTVIKKTFNVCFFLNTHWRSTKQQNQQSLGFTFIFGFVAINTQFTE